MAKNCKLIIVIILSFIGVSFGVINDIEKITTIMEAYENQLDSIKLKYRYTSLMLDEKGNREIVKGFFAQKQSEGYVLLDEETQRGEKWDDKKEASGHARSFNGETTRYLEHSTNKQGYHSAGLFKSHNSDIYKTIYNPYYRIWNINYKTRFTDLLNDPDGQAEVEGEEVVDGHNAIKINFKSPTYSLDCHLWLLPEKNYLPVKFESYRTTDGDRQWEMHWSEFKEFEGGTWYPMKIDMYHREVEEPTTIEIEEMNISPLTKEDFEFKFPKFTHVTDHIIGTSYLTTQPMEASGIENVPLDESSLSSTEKEEILDKYLEDSKAINLEEVKNTDEDVKSESKSSAKEESNELIYLLVVIAFVILLACIFFVFVGRKKK